jgi:hypothetical protein
LVLLRAAWTLYNYLVDYFLKTRHSDANLCLGCVERNRDDVSEERQRVIVDSGKDVGYPGRNIELDDLGRGHEEHGGSQSLQRLLNKRLVRT